MRWGVVSVSVVVGGVGVTVAVDWVDIDAVRVVVVVMVSIMMDIVGDGMVDVMVAVMLSIVVGIVVGVSFVMGWFSHNWVTVVVSVMMRVAGWGNLMLLSVGALTSVGPFIVVSWSLVRVDWLCVGMAVHINNWVVVVGVWVMRVTSWVTVHSLVLVIDSLLVQWFHIMGRVSLEIMVDGLVRGSHIVLSHMVVMMSVSMSVVVVSILKLNLVMVFAILVGSVVDLVLSLVVDVLVSDRVVLSLVSLDVWLDLVDGGLLERSVVRVVVWDVDSS